VYLREETLRTSPAQMMGSPNRLISFSFTGVCVMPALADRAGSIFALCLIWMAPAIGQTGNPSQSVDPSPLSNSISQQERRKADSLKLEAAGDDFRNKKLFSEALDRYRLALKNGQNVARLHNKAGITELSMFRYDDAKKDFDRATRQDRNLAEARNNLGVAEFLTHNLRGAVGQYKRAIVLNGNVASFHSNLGTAYFDLKDFRKANAEYAAALKLDPTIFEHSSKVGASLHLGSPADRARFFHMVAKMYATSGDLDHCITYLKKAMEEDSQVVKEVQKEREFDTFRSDPRFIAVLDMPPASLPQ
jgi:tetratricopeptide (TPR) repeat protein